MMRERRTSPIKLAIVEQGLIQADVATEAGLGESRLSRIVNGRVQPTDVEISRLAKVLGLPKRDLAETHDRGRSVSQASRSSVRREASEASA